MTKSLRCKCKQFIMWLVFVLSGLPVTVYAGVRTVDIIDDIQYVGTILLALAISAGGITATFIPTTVDAQIKYPLFAKMFIGVSFGLFASIFISSRYNLDDSQLFLPAYFLASAGTPMMVYLIGIASDAETYADIGEWIRSKFKRGGK